jgi:hypothetical protein
MDTTTDPPLNLPDPERCACHLEFGHEYRNVGREHFAVCKVCRKVWEVGSNLFSSWQLEDGDVFIRNAEELLAGYSGCEAVLTELLARYTTWLPRSGRN